MLKPSREQTKKLFKKAKHVRIPNDFDEVDFANQKYYSWLDQSDMALFVIYDYHKVTTGIKFDVLLPPAGALRLGFCEFCNKHRKQHDVFFISAETRKRPKGVNYRSRGTWICSNYDQCNKDMKNDKLIETFFQSILESTS